MVRLLSSVFHFRVESISVTLSLRSKRFRTQRTRKRYLIIYQLTTFLNNNTNNNNNKNNNDNNNDNNNKDKLGLEKLTSLVLKIEAWVMEKEQYTATFLNVK